jgi:hypothetical protein
MTKSGMRLAAITSCAALLCGCATMVSKHPLFAPASFDNSEFLTGTYQIQQNGSGELIVERSGERGLRIVGMERDGDSWNQKFYGDGGAIALGGGDYVLQMSCVAFRDSSSWSAADVGPPGSDFRHYTIYGLAMKDRRKNDYWILQNFDGLSPEMLARHGVVNAKIKSGTDNDTVDVIPEGASVEEAKAFFREIVASAMASGNGGPELVEQTSVDSTLAAANPDELKAVTLKTSAECRAIADHGERYTGK